MIIIFGIAINLKQLGKKMNKDLLIMCGKTLYGELWQSQLARALKVNTRTVRRWIEKDSITKAKYIHKIHKLLIDKKIQIESLAQDVYFMN